MTITSPASSTLLKVLIHRDEATKLWVAECSNFSLTAFAKDQESLPMAFSHVFFGKIVVALENGYVPTWSPAPKRVVDAFDRSIAGGATVSLRPLPIPEWLPAAIERLTRPDSASVENPQFVAFRLAA